MIHSFCQLSLFHSECLCGFLQCNCSIVETSGGKGSVSMETNCSFIQRSGLYCPGATSLAIVGGDPSRRPGEPGWLQDILSKSLSAVSGTFTREIPSHYIYNKFNAHEQTIHLISLGHTH